MSLKMILPFKIKSKKIDHSQNFESSIFTYFYKTNKLKINRFSFSFCQKVGNFM